MNTVDAIYRAKAHKDDPVKVFDWDKAARLIRNGNVLEASAGLSEDWEYTGGIIFQEGKVVFDSDTYLASVWAIPEIEIDGLTEECYILADQVPEEWGIDYPGIKWPKSALDILNDR